MLEPTINLMLIYINSYCADEMSNEKEINSIFQQTMLLLNFEFEFN